MKQVSVPMEEPAEKVTKLQDKPKAPVPTVAVPVERPEVKDIVMAPQITDLSKALTAEKPRVDSSGLEALEKADAGTRSAIDKELSAVNSALLKEGPRSPHQSVLQLTGGSKIGSGSGEGNVSIPGMKSLDEALAQTGPIHEGDKTGMPGGALFEYDSYDLRTDSIEQLKKLGMLFQRYPNANFSIQGHTDSFGPPDYNLKLSLARAESVKAWLVQVMGIEPDRIETRGFGNTRWIVPPNKTKEEQAPNRRVEIVVRTIRK
jgi:outer membrane protein OmpA-like peptidoglycan-associated protein